MRFLCTSLVFLGLCIAPPSSAHAADKDAPSILVQMQSIDTLLNQGEYIAGLAGMEEEAKQALGFIRALKGPKGLEGIDTERPSAFAASITEGGTDSPVYLLLPVADQESVLGLFARFGITPEKKDETYSVQVPNSPVTVYFTFAEKYLIATINEPKNLVAGKLPKLSTILPGKNAPTLAVRIRLDRIPEAIKNLGLGQIELMAAKAKEEKKEDESKAEEAFRKAVLDSLISGFKQSLTDSEEVALEINIDPKTDEMSIGLNLTPKADSPLATEIGMWGKSEKGSVQGKIASVAKTGFAGLNFKIPASTKSTFADMLEQGYKQALDQTNDDLGREATKKLLAAIDPTLKGGVFEMAIGLTESNKEGHVALVGGVKVKGGKEIEATVKEIVKTLPEDFQNLMKFDVEKVEGITLHEVEVRNFLDEKSRKVFGDTNLWLGTGENALFVAVGPKVKDLLASIAKADGSSSSILEARGSMARILTIAEADSPEIRKIITEVFGGMAKGNDDTMSLSVEGGKEFRIKLVTKGKALRVFVKNEERKKTD